MREVKTSQCVGMGNLMLGVVLERWGVLVLVLGQQQCTAGFRDKRHTTHQKV